MNLKLLWHRLTHWEYWPLRAIYYPLFPVWLFFSLKARSFFFFNAANPSMKNGGMAMESKMEIYKKIPAEFIPKTVLIPLKSSFKSVLGTMAEAQIPFPCIAKPDIGMKAFGVEKIQNKEELHNYLKKSHTDFLVQEFIPYTKEVGVFFIRQPDQPKGGVTGIVAKEFLSVVGDGTSTILALIKKEPRSHLQLKTLKKQIGNELQRVLPEHEEFILVPYGSHTRGAKFVDVTYKKNSKLETLMNTICTQIDGFYYGRLDILCHSLEALSEGEKFSIVEVNGAGSEATHIYDPKHSLFFAWREVTKHWNHLCNISIANHKKGYPYLSYKEGRAMLRANNKLEDQLKMI